MLTGRRSRRGCNRWHMVQNISVLCNRVANVLDEAGQNSWDRLSKAKI